MRNKKVLYISQEITPYLPANEMSALCQAIPQSVQEKGMEVRTFMPKYGCINERRNQLHEVIRLSGLNISIDDTDHPLIIKVATLQPSRMQVYFIDNDDYFQNHGAATDLETRQHPHDNDERVMFFVRGALETVRKLRWEPAVVHCSGWTSALAPLYIKKAYADDPTLSESKVVFSIFGENFDGKLDERFPEKLKLDGFSDDDIASLGSDRADYLALCRVAIDHSDGVVKASDKADQSLIDYAKAVGKPILDISAVAPEQLAQAHLTFYEAL